LLLRLEYPQLPVLDWPFLVIPDEECCRGLVNDFISATGNAAVRQVICCICAREVFSSEVEAIFPASIPNGELLKPAKSHPAHILSAGMLLYYDSHSRKVPGYACTSCLQNLSAKMPKRLALALANNLWLGEIPFELQILSLCECILVSRFYTVAYIVKLFPKSRGAQGILAATIGVTFIGTNNIPLKHLPPYLWVRRDRVRDALHWLIANNPLYAGLNISETNLSDLPKDGIPSEISDNMKWVDNTRVLDRENRGYVPDHDENNEVAEDCMTDEIFQPVDLEDTSDCTSDMEEGIGNHDDYGKVEAGNIIFNASGDDSLMKLSCLDP
ncbi:hypothetical protein EV359DRAFT_68694, partial [Lentinula novae-zelandiae]